MGDEMTMGGMVLVETTLVEKSRKRASSKGYEGIWVFFLIGLNSSNM